MIVSAIAAIGKDGVIGREGRLPWHLPDDLKRFRAITWGKPIIMGRKTHESLGRALPGRTNIVLTRRRVYLAAGCTVVGTPDEALSRAASSGAEEALVIGGSEVFRAIIPRYDRVYLTIVEGEFAGDVFFPLTLPGAPGWEVLDEECRPADERNPFDIRYQLWVRRDGNTSKGAVNLLEDPLGPRAFKA